MPLPTTTAAASMAVIGMDATTPPTMPLPNTGGQNLFAGAGGKCFSSEDCADGHYCMYDECVISTQKPGTCQETPILCTLDYRPVCELSPLILTHARPFVSSTSFYHPQIPRACSLTIPRQAGATARPTATNAAPKRWASVSSPRESAPTTAKWTTLPALSPRPRRPPRRLPPPLSASRARSGRASTGTPCAGGASTAWSPTGGRRAGASGG